MSRTTLVALLCLLVLSNGCNLAPSGTPTALSGDQTTPRPSLLPEPPSTYFPRPTGEEWAIEEWRYDESCAPPCWNGIVPGVSSAEDVVRILDELQVEGEIQGYAKLSDTHYRVELPSGDVVSIALPEGLVNGLNLSYRGRYIPRLSQVIERFGEPEALGPSRGLSWTRDCPRDEWDDRVYYTAPSTGVYLLYPSQGVTVRLRIPDGFVGRVCPQMQIATLIFYQPRSLEEALQEERSVAFSWSDWDQAELIPWPGYGVDD